MSGQFAKWLGGPNFVYAPQWGTGRSNDGANKKRYGDAGMRRRIRFNPNPTSCNHPSCQISKKSAEDKQKYINSKKG